MATDAKRTFLVVALRAMRNLSRVRRLRGISMGYGENHSHMTAPASAARATNATIRSMYISARSLKGFLFFYLPPLFSSIMLDDTNITKS